MSLTEFPSWFYMGVGVWLFKLVNKKSLIRFDTNYAGKSFVNTYLFATKILHDLHTHFLQCYL